MPIFLEVVCFLLILGLGDLSEFTNAFGRAGHGGWVSQGGAALFVSLIISGILWSIANLRARRSVALNLVALCASVVWLALLFLAVNGMFVWYL